MSSVLIVPYGLPRASIDPDISRAVSSCSTITVETMAAVPADGTFDPVLEKLSQASHEKKEGFCSIASVVVVCHDSVFSESGKGTPSKLALGRNLVDFLGRMAKSFPFVFSIVFNELASTSPSLRHALCSNHCVHMMTHVPSHVKVAIERLAKRPSRHSQPSEVPALFACPVCKKADLNAEELWYHIPQFHVNHKKSLFLSQFPCPICGAADRNEPLAPHVHEKHAPPGQHVTPGRAIVPAVAFGLCVIQRKRDKKFLVVQEYDNQGYWLPGGGIDTAEMPDEAAARECLEEAGVAVVLTGLLRVEVQPGPRYIRLRYIFFGHPKDESEPCKTIPDFESVGSCWVSVEDLKAPAIKWRGREPFDWFTYVEGGHPIPPITTLTREGEPPTIPH